MSCKVEFSPLAELEFQESFDWYEEQQLRLVERFLETIDRSLILISSSPELFPKRRKNQRETVVVDFPFIIVDEYLKKESAINMLHVFHTGRNPKFKYKRK
ncbi:MAG TPA: type II toxin-antitoxin system RelE/ParE family toxin [Mucilaginibacter sp.]|jgi:plasmid stabilization system protein ParE